MDVDSARTWVGTPIDSVSLIHTWVTCAWKCMDVERAFSNRMIIEY